MEAGRESTGPSSRRKSPTNMRSSPSLNIFSVVIIVISIGFLRSSIVNRQALVGALRLILIVSVERHQPAQTVEEDDVYTLRLPRVIMESTLFLMDLSKMRRDAFQYVLKELFFVVQRAILLVLPTLWLRRQPKKLYDSLTDRDL